MLEHGGQLRATAAHYGIPLTGWLDLSTGINPFRLRRRRFPGSVVALPEEQDGLEEAAAGLRHERYIAGGWHTGRDPGIATFAPPVPGRRATSEHAAWRSAGHEVEWCADEIAVQVSALMCWC